MNSIIQESQIRQIRQLYQSTGEVKPLPLGHYTSYLFIRLDF